MTEQPEFVTRWPNLAQPRLGAEVVYATDDFFADKSRLIQPQPPVFIADKYDDHGKWMDGWETRRKRVAGHDWCEIVLAAPAFVAGVDIDTSYFTGNYPPAASLEASDNGEDWQEVLPAVPLAGNAHHYHALSHAGPWQRFRLHIYPDGGVARLRIHGRFAFPGGEGLIDLAGIHNGARPVAWSNDHYGWPGVVFFPDKGINMGDGWETRRRREPGNEWQIVELGHAGTIREIEIDTAHNKGNYPDRVSIQAANIRAMPDLAIVTQSMFWPTLLPEQPLGPHQVHTFRDEIATDLGPITHARINLIPDGGVSRIRLRGEPETGWAAAPSLPGDAAP